ncbi:MAG: DNA recombination protein RmuC [Acidobacteriota bacterium]
MPSPLLIATAVVAALLGAAFAWILGNARRSHEQSRAAAAEAARIAERAQRERAERETASERQRANILQEQAAAAVARDEQTRSQLAEQREFVERSRHDLEAVFRSLAASALEGSTEQLLKLAEQRLGSARTLAASDLDTRRAGIEALLEPLRDTLTRLDVRTAELERSRVDAYSRLDEQVKLLVNATGELHERTATLTSALRGSAQVRGRWGEVTLRNIAELAGMAEHCDFEEQKGQAEGVRPDMTVHLPGGGRIAVDAKAPMTAYMDAAEAGTEAERKTALGRHAADLRRHVKTLAERDYPGKLDGGFDLVVLFLPGDPFLSAAAEQDPDIQINALRARVLIATPTTLVALLRTVALYWQQRSVVENAETIARVAHELYDRAANFQNHLGAVGAGLKKALGAYNNAVGSYVGKLMPMGQRLESLKVTEHSNKQMELLETIDEAPRQLGDD